MDNIKLWRLDNEAAAKAVIQGEDYEPITNSFGANDFVLEFLRENGLWETLINPSAKLLKKENGKDPKILNAIMALKELVGIKRIANSSPLFHDVCLMADLGFNLEDLMDDKAKGVISANTLRHHSNRIPAEESYRAFYEHVNFMRKKKLLRGGKYAVDGYEIEITVDNEKSEYEAAGRVWCEKEKRWKYGYKLLLLVNIQKDRERIVGAYLDRIETNELKIFKKMIEHIEKYVCPLERMVNTIIADRAYWDEKTIKMLYEERGIDIVMLAKKNLGFVKHDLQDLIRLERIEFKKYKMKNRKYNQRKTKRKLKKPSKQEEFIDLELAIEKDLDFEVFKNGYLNVVIRREKQKDNSYNHIFYVTTKPIKNPVRIVDLYRDRTAIENDINRELDQRWFMRSLAGRTRNIMLVRMMLILKLFNCEKILEMKHPKFYEDVKKKMKEKENHSFLQEIDVAVYIYKSDIFGIYKASEFALLIKERTKYTITQKVKASKKPLTQEEILQIINEI